MTCEQSKANFQSSGTFGNSLHLRTQHQHFSVQNTHIFQKLEVFFDRSMSFLFSQSSCNSQYVSEIDRLIDIFTTFFLESSGSIQKTN